VTADGSGGSQRKKRNKGENCRLSVLEIVYWNKAIERSRDVRGTRDRTGEKESTMRLKNLFRASSEEPAQKPKPHRRKGEKYRDK